MQDEEGRQELLNPARDVSSGAEPCKVSLVGLSQDQVVRLSSLQYIADSLHDDVPITEVDRELFACSLVDEPGMVDDKGECSSSGSNGSDSDPANDAWGCDCIDKGLETQSCSSGIADACDCVSSFGYFYAPRTDGSGRFRLLLDALPARLPLVECSSACACGPLCSDRVTQAGVWEALVVKATSSGLGLFLSPDSATSLPSGTFISLYAGEYLTTRQARETWAQQHTHHAGEGNYILSLRLPNETIHIDPRYKGNVGRFLNHSCDPNCVIQVVRWGPDSISRAAIFTKRVVTPGEELTFDYGDASRAGQPEGHDSVSTANGIARTRCLCGTQLCKGWMPYDPTL